MHKLFLMILLYCIGFSFLGKAQQLECSVRCNSGLFWFSGKAAAFHTDIISSELFPAVFSATKPYGKIPGSGLGVGPQFQIITKHNLIIGTQLAVEAFVSQTKLRYIYSDLIKNSGPSDFKINSLKLLNVYGNFNPYFGKRFLMKKRSLDVVFGIDYACLFFQLIHVNTRFSTNNSDVKIKETNTEKMIDFRPRVEFRSHKGKIDYHFGFSYGLSKYDNLKQKDVNTCLFRFGIGYTFKSI